MSEQFDQIRRVVTPRSERKELLVLACGVDRVSWQQACRPSRRAPAKIESGLLSFLEPFTYFLPGRLGQWMRSAGFFTQLSRQLGWLRL